MLFTEMIDFLHPQGLTVIKLASMSFVLLHQIHNGPMFCLAVFRILVQKLI